MLKPPSTSKAASDRGDTNMAADSQRKYPKPILESCFTNRWHRVYQRNNKAKGIKSMRCFPACCESPCGEAQHHVASGRCGRSIVATDSLMVSFGVLHLAIAWLMNF